MVTHFTASLGAVCVYGLCVFGLLNIGCLNLGYRSNSNDPTSGRDEDKNDECKTRRI